MSRVTNKASSKLKEKKEKPKTANHLIKGIVDTDWKSFTDLKAWHNKEFPDKKLSWKTIFKLFNTYSPLLQSLFQLDPMDTPIQRLGVNTALIHAGMWTRNIGNNVTRIKSEHDIRELKGKFSDKAAIVIGAGDSLYDNASHTDHLQLIKEYADKFDGIIIVVGHILPKCLELGIGDYFTVVDGAEVIYDRFFDNKEVKSFSYNIDSVNTGCMSEWEKQSAYEMLKPSSYKMKAFMATCTHPKVVDAWKGQIYFFVASIPQEILPNATRLMCDFTQSSDINAGGNCGMLGWNLAMWMGCKEVALVGMDYSYKVTSPYEKDSNWHQFVATFGAEEAKKQCYREGYNKFFKTKYRIDDVYEAFRGVAFVWFKAYDEHGHKTFNCTESGALEGEGITQMYLKDFLESHLKKE